MNHADPSGHMLGGLGSRTVLIADGMRGSNNAQAVAQKAASTAKKAPTAGYKSASAGPVSRGSTQNRTAAPAVKTPIAATAKTPVSPTVNAKTTAAKVRAQSVVPPAQPQNKTKTTYANAAASNLPSLAPPVLCSHENAARTLVRANGCTDERQRLSKQEVSESAENILGPGALVITKPVENPLLAFFKQEHMSVFFIDDSGTAYFFSYESNVVWEKM